MSEYQASTSHLFPSTFRDLAPKCSAHPELGKTPQTSARQPLFVIALAAAQAGPPHGAPWPGAEGGQLRLGQDGTVGWQGPAAEEQSSTPEKVYHSSPDYRCSSINYFTEENTGNLVTTMTQLGM